MGSSAARSVVDPLDVFINDSESTAFHDGYALKKCIGEGCFGAVYSARCRGADKTWAVKVLPLRAAAELEDTVVQRRRRVREAIDEKNAWVLLGHHPNIVSLCESHMDGYFAYFVMELCQYPLLQAWRRRQWLDEDSYATYLRDMVAGVQHMHSRGVVHRDIKHCNFLLGGRSWSTVKLGDFGMASSCCSVVDICGTAIYMAPELVTKSNSSGFPCDMWALGVIAHMAFFGRWPYKSETRRAKDTMMAIAQGGVPTCTPIPTLSECVVSKVALEFVRTLLERDPAKRPSASVCLAGEFLGTSRHTQKCGAGRPNLMPLLTHALKVGDLEIVQRTTTGHNEALDRMQQEAHFRLARTCLSSQDKSRTVAVMEQKVPKRSLDNLVAADHTLSGRSNRKLRRRPSPWRWAWLWFWLQMGRVMETPPRPSRVCCAVTKNFFTTTLDFQSKRGILQMQALTRWQ